MDANRLIEDLFDYESVEIDNFDRFAPILLSAKNLAMAIIRNTVVTDDQTRTLQNLRSVIDSTVDQISG